MQECKRRGHGSVDGCSCPAPADEWRRSIQQSHSASAARQAALEVFEHELDIIKTAMAKYMPYISRLSDSSDGNDTPDAFRQLAAQVVQWFR